MSTHAVRTPQQFAVGARVRVSRHWAWLGAGLLYGFLVPFVLADVLEINRDLFYGLYALAVAGLFAAWSWDTGYDLRTAITRRWPWAVGLGLGAGALLSFIVLRTEDATTRPDGAELVAQVAWRGIVYGLADGLLLSAFPILIVFAAFAGTKLNRRLRGKVVIGVVALVATMVMTAVYHAGYSDFRSDKVRRPLTGDVMWSVPTLVTLNPIGAPIAHATLHTTAVLHSYDTDVYLPPHR